MRPIRPLLLLQIALAALAAACGTASETSGTRSSTEKPAAQAEQQLYGRWAIMAVNGSAPLRFDSSEAARPSLVFSPASYGGSTGCNSFSGTGLLVGNRWFGEPPMSTQQGCGHLEAQEGTIIGIVSGGPVVAYTGPGEVMLTAKAGSLRLQRQSAESRADPEPMLLAGTRWEVIAIDGTWPGESGRREPRLLAFEADRWSLRGGCGTLSGTWRQGERRVEMAVTSPQLTDCAPADRDADARLRALFTGGPHYAAGPNRELVMGAGDHWLAARFDRSLDRSGEARLIGQWRIESVDGARPAASERPASLIFGKASYAIWDGCNHSEGILLAHAGQLFTRSSGVSTLALCAPDPLRARIRGIVAANPRIAGTGTRGLALVASQGTLRLSRMSARPFGTGEELGLRPPRTIALLEPEARLTLRPRRFTIELPCGRIEGDWRGGQPARFSPDPIERTAPRCDPKPGSDASRLGQFFTGNVLAVTGPNRDIVLLVNEGRSLPARVAD